MWDDRYAEPGWAYGDEPNDHVRACSSLVPPGPVLCLAEGQGRNAVFLARSGHAVTAVDLSEVGLTRARALAAARGVPLTTIQADLATFDFGADWAAIVAIFAHVPPAIRRRMHREVVRALRPGGIYLAEAYTPAQIAAGVGGPKDPALCWTADDLREELAGLAFVVLQEGTRVVDEGAYHRGPAHTVQVIARAPAPLDGLV